MALCGGQTGGQRAGEETEIVPYMKVCGGRSAFYGQGLRDRKGGSFKGEKEEKTENDS